MPMDVADVLTLMVSFGTLVAIIMSTNNDKK
ncbi:putative holin-like toxin [Virgibacillus sp. 179-BFC.A HS]|uniref:Holin-like toxin n=1 Tax=Tigheibacillus jepli TaxID=3035914 RepID=A0ABU5CLJ1_9BACI|nr:putative holin-like toxin [Virgibacillus sp. 179-BFC.A HS]MDY0406766.1 putative holin-like toxin [Virgibacillus sp. 179-BFC.A HS]